MYNILRKKTKSFKSVGIKLIILTINVKILINPATLGHYLATIIFEHRRHLIFTIHC